MQELHEHLKGKSKKGFAQSIEIAPAYLSQILSGHRTPSFGLMVKIEKETKGAVPVAAWVKYQDTAGDAA